MAYRTDEEQVAYDLYRKQVGEHCDFCTMQLDNPAQIVETKADMMIVKARFPYSEWDSLKVIEHLMILPVAHKQNLNDFNEAEANQFLDCLSEYEAKEYSVYLRSQTNTIRTRTHHHTHLFKFDSLE